MVVRRTGKIEITATNIIDGFVVDQKRAVRVLNGAVGRKHGVVWFHDGSIGAGRGIDGELELGLLAIVGSQALEEKSAKARTGATTKGVEDEKALKRLVAVYVTAGRSASFSLGPCQLSHFSQTY